MIFWFLKFCYFFQKHITLMPLYQHFSSCFTMLLFDSVLSPEGRCEAYPVGVLLFLLMFYFGLGNELWKKWSPKYCVLSEFFARNVLSPEGSCESRTQGGPIVFICVLFVLVCVRKRFWHFQNHTTTVIFFLSWKCFIPRRESASQTPKGSNPMWRTNWKVRHISAG